MDVLTTPPLPLAEWLSVVEREYLSAFVPAGGAAVKLAILDDDASGTAAVPWDSLLQRYLEELFNTHAYPWPRPGEMIALADLAATFSVASTLLSRHLDQWLTADLWDDRRLAQDFRAAMLWLCLSRLEPDGSETAEPVMQWLRGEKVAPGLLRAADISVRISRVNARPMLVSLCHFLRKAGATGLLVVLDVRQLAYTPQATGCAIPRPR
jgi:hypothetical protein